MEAEVADRYLACLIGTWAVALMGIRKRLWPHYGIVDEQMNYLQFRTALLGANWTPLVDPQCDGNVYGRPGGPKDDTNIYRQLPELESCSGDGYCSMHFVHEPSDRKVQVVTYGDYTRWELRGGQSDLAVVEWSYQ